jgi:hypothetical protein
VLQFANGQTIGGPYHPPGSPTTIAALDVAFTGVNQATLTFTKSAAAQDGATPKQAEQSLRVVVPEFVNPLPQLPVAWSGGFTLVGTTDTSEPKVYTSHLDFSFTVSLNLVPDKNNPGTYTADLSKAKGESTYNLTYTTVAGTCTGFAEGATSPGVFSADQLQASLNVGLSGLYTLAINVNYPVSTAYDCPGPPPFHTTLPFIYTFTLAPREGAIFTGVVGAEIVDLQVPSGFGSARLDWSFAPCDKCIPATP